MPVLRRLPALNLLVIQMIICMSLSKPCMSINLLMHEWLLEDRRVQCHDTDCHREAAWTQEEISRLSGSPGHQLLVPGMRAS